MISLTRLVVDATENCKQRGVVAEVRSNRGSSRSEGLTARDRRMRKCNAFYGWRNSMPASTLERTPKICPDAPGRHSMRSVDFAG